MILFSKYYGEFFRGRTPLNDTIHNAQPTDKWLGALNGPWPLAVLERALSLGYHSVWGSATDERRLLRQIPAHVRSGAPIQAVRVAKLACMRYPDSLPARLTYADACQNVGMYGEALETYDGLMARHLPQLSLQQRYRKSEGKATTLFMLGDYLAAKEEAEQALTLARMPRALLVRGLCASVTGEDSSAAHDIQAALISGGADADPFIMTMRGVADFMNRDYVGAIRFFDAALRCAPNAPSAIAYRLLAEARLTGKAPGQHTVDWRHLPFCFLNVDFVIAAADVYPVGQRQSAEPLLKGAIAMEPNAVSARYAMVTWCCQIGTIEMKTRALECLKKMPESNPATDLAKVLVALKYGTVAEARSHLLAARSKGIAPSNLRIEQILIMRRDNKLHAAIAAATAALADTPSVQLYGLRGTLSFECKRFHDAAADFSYLIDLGEDNPFIWAAFSQTQYKLADSSTKDDRALLHARGALYAKKAEAHPMISCGAGVPLEEDLIGSFTTSTWQSRGFWLLRQTAERLQGQELNSKAINGDEI